VFSLFSILDVALLRLRLQNRFGLGQGRNLLFLDGYYLIILPFFVVPLNDTVGRWPEITAGRYLSTGFVYSHATLFAQKI
jgi:hypothetical protein